MVLYGSTECRMEVMGNAFFVIQKESLLCFLR